MQKSMPKFSKKYVDISQNCVIIRMLAYDLMLLKGFFIYMEKRTNADINALILAARGGDQAAFETLLHRYSPLIESLSLSFSSVTDTEDKDDFYQEACIAFYRAVEHFDVSQTQVEFGLYAKTCIRNRLLSFCRKLRHRDLIVGLDSETETACECDPSQSIVEKENFLALYQRIESILSPYESRVWWLYLSGRTAKEIAVQVEREERSVQNAIFRIRKKLRSELPSP